MFPREIFRDPETGRFISRETAEELGVVRRLTIGPGGPVEVPFNFEEPPYEPPTPYDLEDSKWGGRIIDHGSIELDWDRLGNTAFPWNMDQFRVTFSGVQKYVNGRNEFGFMSSSWYESSEWPPAEEWLSDHNAAGISHIVFRKR